MELQNIYTKTLTPEQHRLKGIGNVTHKFSSINMDYDRLINNVAKQIVVTHIDKTIT